MPQDHTAHDISRLLAARMLALCLEILPRGRREGSDWRVHDVGGDPGSRLAIRVYGDRAGLWVDHADGAGGDALALVAAVKFHGDIGAALAWARGWLNLGPRRPGDAATTVPPQPPPTAPEPDAADRRRRALGMWLRARPDLRDTPVDLYLRARGIEIDALRRAPRALRYHPALWNPEIRAELPAMVAAVVNGAGVHVATHRTWLGRRDGVWRKADLRDPKRSYGPIRGGHIPLARGASGKPLAQAPRGETVALAEGIETALSVAIACPDLRVLAGVSLGNLCHIELPKQITSIILCADNDDSNNPAAERGLRRAIDHFDSQGRAVRIARSPIGKDFNDALVAGRQ